MATSEMAKGIDGKAFHVDRFGQLAAGRNKRGV
jgi:hypothetical protein